MAFMYFEFSLINNHFTRVVLSISYFNNIILLSIETCKYAIKIITMIKMDSKLLKIILCL